MAEKKEQKLGMEKDGGKSGETGATAASLAVINAVVDALAPFGVTHIDMPAKPEKI